MRLKILEHDSSNIVFTCGNCGCRFEANQREYKTEFRRIKINGVYAYFSYIAKCDCPVCTALVTKILA